MTNYNLVSLVEKDAKKSLLIIKTVTDYFNERGRNVYNARLDVSKEFNSVYH